MTTSLRCGVWEAKFGLGGVLMSLPALQVNRPSREADACYKPVQIATTTRCGMSVPDTVVTNDAPACADSPIASRARLR